MPQQTLASLPPLAVDLDRTLIRTDSLVEQFLGALFRHPRQAVAALQELRRGKAHLKSAVMAIATMDHHHLPYNEELLDFLRDQRTAGRELHLVTAADQRIADLVADGTGIFDSATGSKDGRNLKGHDKLRHLEETFPDGFSYAGDSRADLVIWERAKSAILVGVAGSTRRSVAAMGVKVELDIASRPAGIRDWLRLLRIHQWSKNVLLFVPLILGQTFTQPSSVIATIVGFFALSLAASGTYIFNDVSDIAADRAHPTKRLRPIASGVIDAGHALIIALVLIVVGFGLMALESLTAVGLLVVYLATSLAYSSVLKRLALVDIFVLGSLYTLRILIGGYLANAPSTHWLIMFSFFFFFGLSMAKRQVEIVNAGKGVDSDVAIKGRGYKVSDAPLTLSMGVAAQFLSLLVLSLYVSNDVYQMRHYNHPDWLYGVVILVMIWSSRIWLLSHRGELEDDPVSFALKDPPSLLMGAATAVVLVLSII